MDLLLAIKFDTERQPAGVKWKRWSQTTSGTCSQVSAHRAAWRGRDALNTLPSKEH